MDASATIPSPRDEDDEDVHWALSTASALWGRGERSEALKWLRRAAETASDANADTRALELFKAAAEVAQRIGSIPPSSASAAPPSAAAPPATQASAAPPPSAGTGAPSAPPQVGVVHARQAPPPRRPNASFKQTATLMSPVGQPTGQQQPPPAPPPPPSNRGRAAPQAPGSDPGGPPPLYAREPRSVQPPRSGEAPTSASQRSAPPAPASNRGAPVEPFPPASPRQPSSHPYTHAAPTQHGGSLASASQPSTSPYGGSSHPPTYAAPQAYGSPGHAHGTQAFGTPGHVGSRPPQSGHAPASQGHHGGHGSAGHGHAGQGAATGNRVADSQRHVASRAASTMHAPLAPLIDDDADDEQLAEMAQSRTPIGGIAAVPDPRIAVRQRYDEEVTIRRDLRSLGIRFEDLDEETHIVSGKPQQLGRVVVAVERFQAEDAPPPSSAPPSSDRSGPPSSDPRASQRGGAGPVSAAPVSRSGLRAYDDIRDSPAFQQGNEPTAERGPMEAATMPALRVAVLGTADQGDVQLVLLPYGTQAPEGAATAMLLPASAADAAAIARLFEPSSDD